MLGQDLPDLAVQGEAGIDVFHRQDLPDQGRSRYRCIGTLRPGASAPDCHEPDAARDHARLLRAIDALHREPALSLPLTLGDARGFIATSAVGDPMALFLRIDFLRAWTLADLGLTRFRASLSADPRAVLARPGYLSAQIALAYDFNRLAAAVQIAHELLPVLPPPDHCDDGVAFGLRMLGDLTLRAGQPALSLRCFEGALAIGTNPHRRARALAAALALGDSDAIARHSPPARQAAR
jgi:hypothetical protein